LKFNQEVNKFQKKKCCIQKSISNLLNDSPFDELGFIDCDYCVLLGKLIRDLVMIHSFYFLYILGNEIVYFVENGMCS